MYRILQSSHGGLPLPGPLQSAPPTASGSPPPGPWRRLVRSRGLRSLLLVALLGFGVAHVLEAVGGAGAVRARVGLWAALVLVPLHALVAVSPAPGELVAVAHGPIYGFALGSLFTWAGWMLAALLEYSLYRRIASDVGTVAGLERVPRWLRRLPAHHPAFLALVRFLPFGNHLVNTLAGLSRVPLLRFCWPTALALVPIALGFTAIAIGATRP